jgi:hypothetical protein
VVGEGKAKRYVRKDEISSQSSQIMEEISQEMRSGPVRNEDLRSQRERIRAVGDAALELLRDSEEGEAKKEESLLVAPESEQRGEEVAKQVRDFLLRRFFQNDAMELVSFRMGEEGAETTGGRVFSGYRVEFAFRVVR